MSEVLGAAAALVALLLGLCTLAGLVVRFGLLPYLEKHLIEPVKETHKQVTVNHHSSETPTVLDRIDDVSEQVAANTRLTAENTDEIRANTEETRALARMFDGHLEAAESAENRFQAEVDRIWATLKEKRDRP